MSERLQSDQFKPGTVDLFQELRSRGTLDFPTHDSGFFSASDIHDPATAEETGMHMAWYRDNAHVAAALLEMASSEGIPEVAREEYISKAAATGEAFLKTLHQNEAILQQVIADPDPSTPRLPVRFDAKTLENDHESRNQTDSTAYAVWLPAKLILADKLSADKSDLDIMALTVRYLEAIRYWEAADDGQWEEDSQLHASSIGVAVASLIEVEKTFDKTGYQSDIDFKSLIGRGQEALVAILPVETLAHPGYPGRQYDASHLFLATTMDLLDQEQSQSAIDQILRRNVRDVGTIRYPGDSYWGIGFEELFPDVRLRTTATEGSSEMRNLELSEQTKLHKAEAQWTLFDPLIAEYFLARGSQAAGLHHLDRTLGQIVTTDLGQKLPELFHLDTETNVWKPNPHVPLIWSQANLVRALKAYQQPPSA